MSLKQQNADTMPQINEPIEALLTVAEVEATLGVPRQTLYNWNSEGKFPELKWVKLGSKLAMKPSVLRAFIEARSV